MLNNYIELKNSYIKGWKTWNVNSVFSYVHFPDGLVLNLGFKEYREGGFLREALIGRFQDKSRRTPNEVLFPGKHAIDDSYTSMTMKWCDMEVLVETAVEKDEIYILLTPLQKQVRAAMVTLEAEVLYNMPGVVDITQNSLVAKLTDIEFEIYSVNAEKAHDPNVPLTGKYLSVLLDEQMAFCAHRVSRKHENCTAEQEYSHKTIEEISRIVSDSKNKLIDKYSKYDELAWMVEAMECAISWDTIYDAGHNRVISPVSRLWSIGSGGYVLFCWDTFFAAVMAAMSGSRELAYSNFIEIINEATDNGFIPNLSYGTGQKSLDRSQPPVGSMVLEILYNIYGEKWLVEEYFEPLYKWNSWFTNYRQTEYGTLCWGSNPFEPLFGNEWEVNGVNDRYGGALESGLDNSPMYDDIPFDKENHMLMLEDVGLTGLYIMDCDALIRLSQIAGRDDLIEELLARREKASAGLERLWNEEYGFYCNRRLDTEELSMRISPTNFYALFDSKIPKTRVERIIQEHYYNSEEFYGEWMLPSIARNDPAFLEQDYWRGRVWAPLNYLTYLAFKKQGCDKECLDLAEKSIHIFEKEWSEHRHVHENYNAITGEGCDSDNSDRFYHWGALLSVIALLEKKSDNIQSDM